jgi:5-methylcytosine-specific restriction endonuclease McrA
VSAYRGATRDTYRGRAMLAAVEAVQGPRGVGSCAWPGCLNRWQQVDHILARALGGTDAPANLQGLCTFHNAAKGDGTQRGYRRPAPRLGDPGERSRRWLT